MSIAQFSGMVSGLVVVLCCLGFVALRLLYMRARSDPYSELHMEDAAQIGMSSTGPVYATSWKGQLVAVKRLYASKWRRHTLFDADIKTHSFSCRLQLGMEMLAESLFVSTATTRAMARTKKRMEMHNSNIMPILGISRGQYKSEILAIMPRMQAGTIADLIATSTYILDSKAVVSIAHDVANAMSFFHSCSPPILGKNLKPHHLFLDGSFRTLIGISFNQMKTDSLWAPPECLRGESPWTKEADIYAFSMLLYTLTTGKKPFKGRSSLDWMTAIKDADEDTMIDARPHIDRSTHFNPLIEECWSQSPENRPNFSEIRRRLQAIQGDQPGARTSFERPANVTSLLEGMFPEHVRRLLERGQEVPSQEFPSVTIFFSDIKGFTEIAALLEPPAVQDMLNRLFSFMDNAAERHGVHKMETIGDAASCLKLPLQLFHLSSFFLDCRAFLATEYHLLLLSWGFTSNKFLCVRSSLESQM